VFLKVNKATINMLRRVEPYVAYGYIFFADLIIVLLLILIYLSVSFYKRIVCYNTKFGLQIASATKAVKFYILLFYQSCF
jgi:hypothetical protein